MENCKNMSTFKYEIDNETYEFSFKKLTPDKEEKLLISVENEDNEIWEFQATHTNLIDIDPIFKKISEMNDLIDLIQESFLNKTLKIEKIGDKLNIGFNVKFIKNESNPRFTFNKKFHTEENQTITCINNLKKEIEILKKRTKVPVINYVDCLKGDNKLSGELNLKYSQSVTFHLFIDYKLIYTTNTEEFLYFQVINPKSNEEYKEKLIYKTWHGCYQGGSGYQDSKILNFMFIENLNKGNNNIILRKKGKSEIYTLYLIAEI